MALPRDFLDEVENELDRARASLSDNRDRVRALRELRRLAVALAAELRRPITVFDLVRSAVDSRERERRVELVRLLRSSSSEPTGPTTRRPPNLPRTSRR
jgi:hypothetical protein